jgi:hypothetical protein
LSANIVTNPLHPRFSVLALLPQMKQENPIQRDARPVPAHQASTPDCECHLGEEKANRNIRISEIELCIRKHAIKQFSNRNKNASFGLSKHLETSEKRS